MVGKTKLLILFLGLLGLVAGPVSSSMNIVVSPNPVTVNYLAENDLSVGIYYNETSPVCGKTSGILELYVKDLYGNILYERSLQIPLTSCGYLSLKINGLALLDALKNYMQSCQYCSSSTSLIISANITLVNSSSKVTDSNSTTLQIVNQTKNVQLLIENPYDSIVSKNYLTYNGYNLIVYVLMNDGQLSYSNTKLNVKVYDSIRNIIYQSEQNVQLKTGSNVFEIKVPANVFTNVYGEVYMEVSLTGVFKDGTQINQKQTLRIFVTDKQSRTYVDVISVSPNFDLLKELEQGYMNVYIKLYNPTSLSQNVRGELYVYDSYGNQVYSTNAYLTLYPYGEDTLVLPLGLNVNPGEYSIVIKLYGMSSADSVYTLLNQYTYYVFVGKSQWAPLKVLRYYVSTSNILPGSFVQIVFQIKNPVPKTVSVSPILESDKLNVHQQLSELTFSGYEVKELPVVVYIPENLEYGYYPLTLELNYGESVSKYTINLLVNGTKPVFKPVSLSLVGYPILNVGTNTTINVLLSSNDTNIHNLILQVVAENAQVYPTEQYVQIGGYYSKSIPINVTALSPGTVKLNITLIDASTGKVVDSLEQTFTAQGKAPLFGLPSLRVIIYALIILAIIILLVAVIRSLLRKRKTQAEKPEE